MSKLKKFGIYFGIFCVGIIGLIILVYSIEDLRGKAAWKNFKQEWEAKGEVFDYKQIVPKAVPSEKNFAHIPLLKPLHQHQWNEDLSEATPIDQKSFDQSANLLKLDSNEDTKLGGWMLSQSVDLTPWQKMFRDQEDWPHPEEAGEPAADILMALEKHKATMAELAQAAKDRPLCQFDIKYEAHFAALLPHVGPLRNFTKNFSLRALAHLGNDDPEAALADVRMGLFLTESMRQEPLLISQLVRIACLNIALQPVWEGLKEEKWNTEQLTNLEKQLATIELLKGYQMSILGERELANLAIDQMAINPKVFNKLVEGEAHKIGLAPAGWLRHNQKRLNEMHLKFSQRIVDPKARRIHPDIAVAFNKELNVRTKRKLPIHDMFSMLLLPAIDKVAIKTGAAQSAVDHARIGCLLELHKIKHKQYPAKLADLKKPLRLDPYNGKPYIYKVDQEGRYQLYGIGWNQKDDGGGIVKKGDRTDLEKGDLVWSYSTQDSKGK
jgi:hypothetical protein